MGIDVEVLPFSSVAKFPKILRHKLFFWKTFFAAKNAAIIYAQDPVSVGLPSALVSIILRKPFFVRVAGDYAWEQGVARFGVKDSIDDFQKKRYGFRVEMLRSIQKFVVRHAHQVITPSHYFTRLVQGWVTDTGRVTTIYNGIDLQAVSLESSFIPKTIISAGRLVAWKGFSVLIDVMKELPDWKLCIAGDGPEKAKLEKQIHASRLENRVFLLGQVERNALMKKVAESEIFILNTHFESFSFQVVEAMHIGTPVITTTIGNLSEIIDNGKEGILVTPDDTKALQSAILRFHTDSAFRALCLKNAKQKALQFDVNETLRQLKKLMEPYL